MSVQWPLAVQSYCFRSFKENDAVARNVRAIGLSRIEICSNHVDFWNVEEFDDVVSAYKREGVSIVSAGVATLRGVTEKDKHVFEFAQRCGTTLLSVDFPMEIIDNGFEEVERMAEDHGVFLALHNHGGRHWLGNRQALRWLFSRTSARIGLCLDTAWALDTREDPRALTDEFGPRLYALHLKDFIFERTGQPIDVIAGEGNLNLESMKDALVEVGFEGPVIIEYEGNPDNPVPALKDCIVAADKVLPLLH
jgi:sugar phosphate isomerase/epimerase